MINILTTLNARWVFLVLSFFFLIFSYVQPIALCGWLWPTSFLLCYQTLCRYIESPSVSRKRCVVEFVIAHLVLIASATLAAFDLLYGGTVAVSCLLVPILFVLHWLYFRFVRAVNCNNSSSFQTSHVVNDASIRSCGLSLLYPCVMTSMYILINFTPLSSVMNPANALYSWNDLLQFASLFGINGICFLQHWFAVLVLRVYNFYYLRSPNADKRVCNNKTLLHEIRVFASVFAFALIYGGIRLNCSHFWQDPQTAWPNGKNVLSVACVTRRNELDAIKNELMPGDGSGLLPTRLDLILLSEEFADEFDNKWNATFAAGTGYDIYNYDIETDSSRMSYIFNDLAKNVSVSYDQNVFVALTADDNPYNNMQLFEIGAPPESKINLVHKYLKGNPVPFLEDFEWRADKPEDTVKEITFDSTGRSLKIGMEICFDLLFNDYSRLGSFGVDVMIHPSWLWGSFSDMFVMNIALRSVENGYNILHCANDGNAAFINQYGMIMHKQVTGEERKIAVFDVEVNDAVWTFYSHAGFVMEYAVLVVGCCVLLLGMMPTQVAVKIVAEVHKIVCKGKKHVHQESSQVVDMPSDATGPLM